MPSHLLNITDDSQRQNFVGIGSDGEIFHSDVHVLEGWDNVKNELDFLGFPEKEADYQDNNQECQDGNTPTRRFNHQQNNVVGLDQTDYPLSVSQSEVVHLWKRFDQHATGEVCLHKDVLFLIVPFCSLRKYYGKISGIYDQNIIYFRWN